MSEQLENILATDTVILSLAEITSKYVGLPDTPTVTNSMEEEIFEVYSNKLDQLDTKI